MIVILELSILSRNFLKPSQYTNHTISLWCILNSILPSNCLYFCLAIFILLTKIYLIARHTIKRRINCLLVLIFYAKVNHTEILACLGLLFCIEVILIYSAYNSSNLKGSLGLWETKKFFCHNKTVSFIIYFLFYLVAFAQQFK